MSFSTSFSDFFEHLVFCFWLARRVTIQNLTFRIIAMKADGVGCMVILATDRHTHREWCIYLFDFMNNIPCFTENAFRSRCIFHSK